MGKSCVDLVLKNAFIVNVFDQTIEKGDIAIKGKKIIGVGNYAGIKTIDCSGKYISPGFIDAHVHIESSKVTPETFSNILIKKGVTTCIADPHEIANVLGSEGIKFMLDNSKDSLIDILFMMPSCVPAVEFEDNGATLKAEDLAEFIDNKKVLGLGEVMDVGAVINYKQDMIDKINLFKNKHIDGHCPQINNQDLNKYVSYGIKTDHECSTVEQALLKVKRGMYVMLRHGSAAKNLKNLIPAINSSNIRRFLFCTDDKDIVELSEKGSIDESIRVAIKSGVDPIKAIVIGTLNVAECYNLKNIGAIAPGYKADLVILDDLKNVKINQIIKDGQLYKEGSKKNPEIEFKNSIKMKKIDKNIFNLKAKTNRVNVINTIENSIETKKQIREISIKNGCIEKVNSEDVLKIGVFERHKNTGKYFIGFIEGLGLKGCSIAQTIAHDSHNIVVVGNDDKDMEIAVNTIIEIQGGIVIVSNGEVLEKISLPIGGLMTFKDPEYVISKIKKLNSICEKYGTNKNLDVFLTLGFMALPVIPEVRITARGLYDFNQGKFIDLFG